MTTRTDTERLDLTETAAVVLRLSAHVHKEDGLWVAGCPSLDVFSQGNTEAEARANLQEAVELWIDSCLERNTLAKALQELGQGVGFLAGDPPTL